VFYAGRSPLGGRGHQTIIEGRDKIMFKQLASGAVVIASIVALAGCANSGASSNISVATTDFKFAPTTWQVNKGQPVSLTLQNTGKLQHEWVLLKQGTNVTMPFDEDDEDKVFWEIEAEPGQTKTETFTAPAEAGTYTVVCGTPAHLEQGMAATLVVK
jgi:uncharacterized cupredoxin-like copper-binding protein